MSASLATETGGLPEIEFPIPEHYDDDLSEESVLISPFEISGTLGELSGGGDNQRIDADSTGDGEDETYAEMISHTRVRAALKRPIQLCKFYGVPTCLMVLEIELLETKRTRQMPRLLRFKTVDITVEFKDADGVSKLGPDVVMFCPEKYTGTPTVVMHSSSTTIEASITASDALPVGPHIGLHQTHASHFARSCNSSITGRALRKAGKTSILKWEIKEDEALRQGVPKQLKLVMAVKNPGERAFNMKLNFSGYLGFNDLEFRVNKKQAVLSTRVDPVVLRERARDDENGPEFGRIWQCLADDADLGSIKLEELTNLEGSTVGRTLNFA
jgi:hypothetical protein